MRYFLTMLVGTALLLVGCQPAAVSPEATTVKVAPQYLQTSPDPAPVDTIRAALSSPTDFAFADTPLVEVAAYLAKLHQIEIHLDRRALEDVGLTPEVLCSLNADGISLRSGLRLMLSELELTYVVEQTRLLITTPEQAEVFVHGVFYPCPDLIYPSAPWTSEQISPDFDSLIQVIGTTVSPESWEAVGGPMPGVQPLDNGIVVSQSEEVHEQIVALLAALRAAKSLPTDNYDPTPIHAVPNFDSAAWRELRASLDKVGTPTLNNTPLVEVADYLSQLTGSLVLIDHRALEDIGLSLDLPITCDFQSASARAILNAICHEHELAYVLENEVIMITTPEAAESSLIVKVYPVRDLIYADGDSSHRLIVKVRHGFGGGSGYYYFAANAPNSNPLIQTINCTIEPESWEELGGPGAIAPLEITDALVIAHTEQVHDKIAQLLRKVRQNRQPRPLPSPAKRAEPVLLRYPIPLEDESDDAIRKLAKLITTEVVVDSENAPTRYVQTLGKKTLLVKQQTEMHAKIREWLGKLYPQSEYAQRLGGVGGGGFGGGGASPTPEAAKSGM